MKKILLTFLVVSLWICYALGDITLQVVTTEVDNGTEVAVVPVALYNPSDPVAGVQMDLMLEPYLAVDSVKVAPRAEGFSVSWAVLPDSAVRIIVYNLTGTTFPDTTGDIVEIYFTVTDYMNSIFYLNLYNTVVSGENGVSLDHDVISGALKIGQTVDLAVLPAFGDAGTSGNLIEIALDNEEPAAPVGGVQFDIDFIPGVLYVDTVYVTDRTVDFEVDYSELNRTGRVILYSPSGSDIAPGTGPILNMEVTIDMYAVPQDVIMDLHDVVVGDPDGNNIATVVSDGIFTIEHGYKFPPTNLTAVSGLDGHIPLAWAPPEGGGGPGGPGDTWIQDFESAEFPPPGWTQIITNTSVTWQIYTDYYYEGAQSAGLWWDYSHQDEWLISPEFQVGDGTQLSFWTYGYEGSTYGDHYYVKISTDGGSTWDELLDLSTLTGAAWNEWAYPYVLDLSAYAGENAMLAWQAVDGDGAGLWYIWMVDYIEVFQGERRVMSANTGLKGVFPQGITNKADAQAPETIPQSNFTHIVKKNTTRNRNLMGYNIYRSESSPVEVIPDNRIASVPDSVLTYDDVDVVNGVEYYYVVTADYGDFGESGPSNEVAAMAVRWVHLALGEGQGDPGATGEVELFMDNEQPVGGFQVSIRDLPNWLSYASAATTPRTSGWVVSGSEQADGSCLVLGYNLMGGTIDPGSGAIATITFNVDPNAPIGEVNLNIEDAVISDQTGEYAFPWEAEGNVFLVGTPEVVFALPEVTVVPFGEQLQLTVTMTNSVDVGGFQFDITDPGNYLTPTNLTSDAPSNWFVLYNELSNGNVRVLGYTMEASPIPPGETHITLTFDYPDTMPSGGRWLDVIGTIASDPSGNALFAAGAGGMVVFQQPPYPFALISPEDGTTWTIRLPDDLQLTKQFKWQATFDPEGDEITYGVMFGDALTGAEIPEPVPSDNSGLDTTLTLDLASILPMIGGDLNVPDGVYALEGFWYVLATDGNFVVSSDTFQIHVDVIVGIDESNNEIPDKYSLSQNYPNPFNPTTTIWFSLPQNDRVKLVVYNILGQEVKTLVNGNFAAGKHSVRWDGTDNQGNQVRSGMYFYKIQTEKYTATRKMLLMK